MQEDSPEFPSLAEGTGSAAGREDPTGKYPKPPFKRQRQPWSGLASKDGTAARPRRDELQGFGPVIIATTSEQAYDASPDLYDYAQTKAATMNYVKSLAKQLGPKDIRVDGVAPGPIWTPLQISGGASMEKVERFGGQTPLGRPGQPAELASIFVQRAAADASYASGQIYGAAGGSGQP